MMSKQQTANSRAGKGSAPQGAIIAFPASALPRTPRTLALAKLVATISRNVPKAA